MLIEIYNSKYFARETTIVVINISTLSRRRKGEREILEREREREREHEVESSASPSSLPRTLCSFLPVKVIDRRRLQTRAARLQLCTPGCIRVGVGVRVVLTPLRHWP